MKKIMYSRGPDHQGNFTYKKDNFFLNFYSSRLSIIDLDKRSNQPLVLTILF